MRDVLSQFREPTRAWFQRTFGTPTRVQALGWQASAEGESALLLAPTGSGKTLAAFLYAIDRLMEPQAAPAEVGAARPKRSPRRPRAEGIPSPARGVRVLYISPLKALAADVEKNLRAPLLGIAQVAEDAGTPLRLPTVAMRTGDTPATERASMVRKPPDILITTPESLYLLLTSQARAMLRDVETVIIDEIHTLVATKRGAHLALSLERLEELKSEPARRIQRVGLSATQRPLDEVARLLGGLTDQKPRPVTIVDAGEKKKLSLRVEVPDIDMARLGEIDEDASGPAASGGARRSIWPHLHQRLVDLVRGHRSTMIFVNSRRLAERLAAALNEIAEEEIALAHHGSVAREKRREIEDRLKAGQLRSIVATSSLELGIDMGAVDLVVQVEAPLTIASGLQRVGRASHSVDATSTGIIFPKHRGDLVASAAAVACMREGEVEHTFYPRNPLDVLAQQIVAICAEGSRQVDDVFDLVRRAAPFAELPKGAFEGVLDMLSGRYPSDAFADLRPRITWDRVAGKLTPRQGAAQLAIANGGTIPDRGLYGVFLRGAEGGKGESAARRSLRVGELDEEMVFELREGEVFLLGASSWRVDEIAMDRVWVTPAAGEPGKMPFWHGERAGRSRAFGTAVGALTRQVAERSREEAAQLLAERGLEENAANNCVTFVHQELEEAGAVPSDKQVVVERFVDEVGDFRVCVLTPFGSRVHAPWATAVLARLRAEYATVADAVWSDDGMAFRLSSMSAPPPSELFLPSAGEVEELVTAALGQSSLFAARFRENAARALLLPRRRPGKRTPLWMQRKRAGDLLSAASQYPAFPILLETYRECLRDVFDLPGLVDVLKRIAGRKLRVHTVDVKKPSPFAASLLFSFVANFIYEGDSPLAERRAQALTIDHAQLRELLGETELRALLDPAAIDEHVAALQKRIYPTHHADGVHDLLLALGDLSDAEIAGRLAPEADLAAITRALEDARRIFRLRIAGEERWAAAEDAGRFRDALGVPPPRGLPSAFLTAVPDAPLELVARYARTHGPFVAEDVAARLGLGARTVLLLLERLLGSGKVVEGAFLQERRGEREFCDASVLATLRRKSLARLRREIEPVEPEIFARFLVDWHQLGAQRRGPEALLGVIAQLEGLPLPASELEREILPARLPEFKPWDLDALCASGEVVWAGVGSLGPSDGRIALYLADHEPLLALPVTPVEGETARAIRELLDRRGAVFFAEITRVVGGLPSDVLAVLWSMVWAGEVTNDTCEALRSHAAAASSSRERTRRTMRSRLGRSGPPGSEGRWSLRSARWPRVPSETERRAAMAGALLNRHGVVTREALETEGVKGGFSSVYEVLKTMEESGRIRRGYFVAGRGATQFALPGADERLRDARRLDDDEHRTVVLAATDPANPWGSVLPWPESVASADKPRLQRAAGAKVILHDGALIGYLSRSSEALVTFLPTNEPERENAARALAEALGGLVTNGRRRALLLSSVDGQSPSFSALGEALARTGFHPSRSGMLLRRGEARRGMDGGAPHAGG